MQDRVSRSRNEISGSTVQADVSSSWNLAEWKRRPRGTAHWFLQVTGVVLTGLVFAALVVGSEFVVTNFRVMASEPSNAPVDNVLLDFTARWCGPCQQMSPIVSRLERQNFPIRKVNIDLEKGLARQFGVESIPCFVLVVNGREVNRITGATDEKELRRLLAMLPRQSLDDSMVAKSPKQTSANGSVANTSVKNPDDKKSMLRIPSLFPKSQEKERDREMELALAGNNSSDTFRGQNPNQDANGDQYTRDPMQVSIRIRVTDGTRLHFGSGTLIDSQPGRAVALTCGHIFRDLSKDAMIEVDLFISGSSKPHTVVGQVLRYDLKSDVGLIALPIKNQMPVIRLSSAQNGPVVKDRVFSFGCGGGERPTREEHRVTGINKFLGPDNIECDGVPQQGRSGGGLFHNHELIGVCIAADPKEKRGIYTSMKPIAQLLEKAQLGYLAPSYLSNESALAEVDTHEATLGNAAELTAADATPRRDDEVAAILEAATRSAGNDTASIGDYVGAEIVCIVRPKKPGALTRVVIVNQASSRLVGDLLHEPSCASRNDATSASLSPAARKSSDKQSLSKSTDARSRQPSRTQSAAAPDDWDSDRPVETSFEPQRYRRDRN